MDELKRILNELQSPNPEATQEAMQKMKKLEESPEFGLRLTEIFAEPNCDVRIRKTCTKTLIQWIETHWFSPDRVNVLYPEIISKTKETIKGTVLSALKVDQSDTKRREAVYDITSAIIRLESEKCDYQFLHLIICRLIEEHICSTPSIAQEFIKRCNPTCLWKHNIAQSMLEDVLRKLNVQEYEVQTMKSMVLEIFIILLDSLCPNDCPGSDAIHYYLNPIIPSFCDMFTRILKMQNCLKNNVFLKTTVVRAITKLAEKLPEYVVQFSTPMFPPFWKTLMDSSEAYQKTETPNDYDDLITALLEFFQILLSGPKNGYLPYILGYSEFECLQYDWFYLQGSIPIDVFRSLIILMEPTDKQIKLWSDNPSQFIKEEERGLNSLSKRDSRSIRGKVEKLLLNMVHFSSSHRETWTEDALTTVILKELSTKLIQPTNYGVIQKNWKQYEAFLLAFRLVRVIIEERSNNEALSFSVIDFLEYVVLADLNNSKSHPLVICQCLRIGKQFTQFMPLETEMDFLEANIHCLQDNQPTYVRICAANSPHLWLSDALTTAHAEEFEIHVQLLFTELLNLGNQTMSACVLRYVLKNFAVLILLDEATTSLFVDEISKLAASAFSNFHNDDIVRDNCRVIFRELALNPEWVESLKPHLGPTLINMLSDESNELAEKARVHVLLLLKLLVENWSQPLQHNSLFLESVIPAVCRSILSHNDHMTLISGADTMRTFFSMAGMHLMEFRDIHGNTGSQYILQIASHLLNPQFKENLVTCSCEIVTSLIQITDKLEQNFEDLLKAMIYRLSADNELKDLTQRQLLILFAHLFSIQFNAVYKYLSHASGPSGKNALSFVLYDGFCKKYESFTMQERELIVSVLAIVLEHGVIYKDSRLQEITVQEAEKEIEKTIPLIVAIAKFNRNILSKNTASMHLANKNTY